MATAGTPDRIGRYRIEGLLGEGGMGVVYAARDESLDRRVAIKTLRESGSDALARDRLRREARTAAAVNHPHICQVYEVGEHDGEVFLALELLQGRSLAARLMDGALPVGEAIESGLAVLSALAALHRAGLVHRDLKPSNVFLTPHGVKLLDFGLARPVQRAADSATDVTLPGTLLGTPHYMAPEQLDGQPIDPRADLFAMGIVLYELLTAERPFTGTTAMQVFHAIAYEQPPALAGSPAVAAVDRVIRRALAKRPSDRYATAELMAEELRLAWLAAGTESDAAVRATPMTRLIVLPFRLVRSDPDIEFLTFSLADAIASSLSGLESLVVRSSIAAATYASGPPDLARIASETQVDVVVYGTLLRAGDQVRVSTQLVEAPAGTVLWTHTSQARTGDLFALQDDLASRVVESLSLPLTAREHRRSKRDVPGTAHAYEFYLRANQLAVRPNDWAVARDLYARCLEDDPRFAPAWARIGRLHRLLGKYGEDPVGNAARAEQAFGRALEINPDLAIAHTLYAQLEVEQGRSLQGLRRLVSFAKRSGPDPDLYAALVHACRYSGLLEASVAAHDEARRLDPTARTSVAYTWWMLGDYERALAEHAGDTWIRSYVLTALGREAEAVDLLRHEEARSDLPIRRLLVDIARLSLEGDATGVLALLPALEDFSDPEGAYFVARILARFGLVDRALQTLERSALGFLCFDAFARDPWLDTLRRRPELTKLLRRTEARQAEHHSAFLAAGGYDLLGPSARGHRST